MSDVKIKQKLRKLDNINTKQWIFCNAKTGDVKAQTPLLVLIKVDLVSIYIQYTVKAHQSII